jgi:hypothetical protein
MSAQLDRIHRNRHRAKRERRGLIGDPAGAIVLNDDDEWMELS